MAARHAENSIPAAPPLRKRHSSGVTIAVCTWRSVPRAKKPRAPPPCRGRGTQAGSELQGAGEIGETGFGASAALSAEGTTALIGGYGDNSGVGAAWVFTNTASAPPVNTSPPMISGTAHGGQPLSCSTGSWTGNPPPTFSYQWLSDGVPIGGATGTGYTVQTVDEGHTLSCRVTASNNAGSQSADSAGAPVPPSVLCVGGSWGCEACPGLEVKVRDLVRRKTKTVSAGRSYIATAQRRRHCLARTTRAVSRCLKPTLWWLARAPRCGQYGVAATDHPKPDIIRRSHSKESP